MPSWVQSIAGIPNLDALPTPLRVAELPAGLLTGVRALKMMNVPLRVRHAYDILQYLSQQDMSDFSADDQKNMFWGRVVGDLLSLTVEEMELVHILLSGPCCPPWSSLGLQGMPPSRVNYFNCSYNYLSF